MAQAMTAIDEAKEAVKNMEGQGTTITHDNEGSRGRQNFRFDGGAVNAHLLKDGWKVVGFGNGWFSIRPE